MRTNTECESDITVVCNHDDDHVIARTITNQIEKESASIGFETWGQRTYDPAPARSLKAKGRSVELFDKVIKSTVLLLDGLCKGSVVVEDTAPSTLLSGGREVLPEERVVDVTCPSHKCEKRLRLQA